MKIQKVSPIDTALARSLQGIQFFNATEENTSSTDLVSATSSDSGNDQISDYIEFNDNASSFKDSSSSQLNHSTATSIIGGASLISKEDASLKDFLEENEDRKERSQNEEGQTIHQNISTNYTKKIKGRTNELLKYKFKSDHRIFSFSLPFGGNPLAHLPSINFKSGISMVNSPSNKEDFNRQEDNLTKEEIKNKLKRQETISTVDEARLYSNSKGIDSSRLRAVKRALKPNITLPSILDDKKKQETIWETIDEEIVILGGYRGSILRDASTHRRVWIPIRAGFNIRKINLLIGPTDNDENQAERDIYSDDMMTHLGPVDISRRLKAKLQSNGKSKVHTYGYDWRLSPEKNSSKLYEFLNLLECNQYGSKRKGAIVIAHSMGGLIAHHVMQRDSSLFKGIIYAGVPSECPNILGPIRFGDAVLFSNKILTPEVNFFMRSSFSFLPRDGRCFVDKNTGERYDLDYFDADTWVEHELSPLVSKSRLTPENHDSNYAREEARSPSQSIFGFDRDMKISLSVGSLTKQQPEEFETSFEDSYDYLKRTLKRSKKFLDDLDFNPSKDYPPLVIVYGDQVPTVRGCRVSGVEGIKNGQYSDFFYGPGDGVVNHKWLMPERRGFPVEAKISSDAGHISLLTDMNAMSQALETIILAR
ncbi:hypothetical protein WICMUC_000519 [Wickerhamomyces mucosus]|uniref:Uncharacterized protein n=1 Tax=Wickerhamomyces mucosus TaxID=1378264 RepID=A0A9P8THT9_9ASCO|nr:hypothetical protein WICMUC_000519 [Wickerhamomyces mucosus]